MPLTSDLSIAGSKLSPEAISQQTRDYNDALVEIGKTAPKWWQVGAARYREMRWNGETSMPKPEQIESGKNFHLPSREAGRQISCRSFHPQDGEARGVFYHIHGGGWVLQSEAYQDTMLKYIADNARLVVISVGYRLAPENPYPDGNEDCVDVGEYLIDHAERDFGVPLKFLGGDSAGGHLSAVTCHTLLETRPNFAFKGLVLNFGAYNLAGMSPQVYHFDLPLVLTQEIMEHFISLSQGAKTNDGYIAAYLPNTTEAQRRNPKISPLYADLKKMKLPPALFVCGTLDALLDDSIMMSTKWGMSGAESILKLYPGAPHGFTFFPRGGTEQTQAALDDTMLFIQERL